MSVTNKEKLGYGPFVAEVLHQFALISMEGFEKPPRKLKVDYIDEITAHKKWFEEHLTAVTTPATTQGELKIKKVSELQDLLAEIESSGIESTKAKEFKEHLEMLFKKRVERANEKKMSASAKKAAGKKGREKKTEEE